MAAIECGRGHLYDPSIYSSCPYCNSVQRAVLFGNERTVQDMNKTMPIQGGNGMGNTAIMGGASAQFGDIPVTDSGKTLPPLGYRPKQEKKVEDDNKTIGMMKKKYTIDPVVGWLVCIKGKEIGKDYRIRGQINTIGRSEKMDICIKGDDTISHENHARISYSEKNNRFNLIPADSKNIIYLNGEEVFTPTILQSYDVIELGESCFSFIPYCSDRFNWKLNNSGGEGDATV